MEVIFTRSLKVTLSSIWFEINLISDRPYIGHVTRHIVDISYKKNNHLSLSLPPQPSNLYQWCLVKFPASFILGIFPFLPYGLKHYSSAVVPLYLIFLCLFSDRNVTQFRATFCFKKFSCFLIPLRPTKHYHLDWEK